MSISQFPETVCADESIRERIDPLDTKWYYFLDGLEKWIDGTGDLDEGESAKSSNLKP